ncbi:hypothetical protein SYNPS1DRAFT_21664 [Syncephalis pseudoplumigaleata]|uniref:Biogenesis of lysosome-related organelles complex 1 subunit 7 n=1 Tax=Syncephalis pseudoplumigaleata TaxID=1712513 RepID=A0A4P9Z2A7_9FUNG|nr:hypothetical protein SYNPS1DRAFT_21664 [Syncephalis pseudoplumigaleata]|eukprot:RKP26614.1 hypothetical protein SYNPS1DRAFT_21664 [Syncephalis pseudoplumigaleata]
MSRASSAGRPRPPQLMERVRATRPISPTLSASSGQSPPLGARPEEPATHRRVPSSASTSVMSAVPMNLAAPSSPWTSDERPTAEEAASGVTAHATTQQAILDGLVKVMQTLEDQAAAVRQSQDDLQQQVAHMQAELRRFYESAKAPNLAEAAQKLVHARGKLEGVNNLLLRVQERLDRLHSQIARHIETGPTS